MTNDKRHLIPSSANNKSHDSFDDDEQQQNTANRDLVGSYRRTSFAYGEFRPTFIPGSPLSTSINTLPATERETMREQEQELLRDSVKNYGSYGTLPRPTTSSSNASLTSLGPPEFPEFLNERSRLLRETACWEEAVERGAIHTTYLREAKVVLQSAPLLYITFALQYSLTIASIFSAGRLGKDQLAGVSLGSMTATITGYAVYQGLTTALDTLCSQSYGSGNKTLVGLHLQRMVYFLFCVSVPIAIVWVYSEPILNAMVPEKELVAFASLYLRILTLGLPAYAMFESGKRFLQAQGRRGEVVPSFKPITDVSDRIVYGFYLRSFDLCAF
jgi:MATE family multidrug resistance protein